VINVVVVLMVH